MPRAFPLLPLAAWLAFSSACASGIAVRTHPRPGRHPAAAVAVYPFTVRWDATPAQSLALGDRLALRVARTQRYAVFGPSEFQIRDASQDAFLVLTDLAFVIPAAGVPIDGLVVLRGWVEQHQQSSSSQQVDKEGSKRQGDSSMQTSYVGHLELYDAASGDLLADAQSAPTADANLGPQLDLLADRLLDTMRELTPGTELPRRAWWGSETVAASGISIAAPSAESAAAGLREGDVVVEVGAAPASDLAIERARRLAAEGATIPVVVHRAAGDIPLNLPVSH